jgi:hypothetical protein
MVGFADVDVVGVVVSSMNRDERSLNMSWFLSRGYEVLLTIDV